MERRYVIGIDEAGYGPNIGPLVVAATLWSLPADQSTETLWTTLQDVLTCSPGRCDHRLHVADSKQVYQSGAGLSRLELGVLALAGLVGLAKCSEPVASSLMQLVCGCQGELPASFARQPWYEQQDVRLPLAAEVNELAVRTPLLNTACEAGGVRLERIGIQVVCPERFNELVERWGNKSSLLSHVTFQLLQKIWPADSGAVEVRADKHGGRNRYQEYLLQYFPDRFYLQERESRDESRYRSGEHLFVIGTRSERHLPVALASMTAKYVRELCLELFNQYWQTRLPGLKATRGYPQDARRFLREIESTLVDEPHLRPLLWRDR